MATITNTIRWADNTKELAANLKEGLTSILLTQQSVDKLAQSLGGDKLIAAAQRAVLAITQIGGATTLTADEATRNLSLIEKALDKLAVTGKTVPPAMLAMRDSLKQVADAGDKSNTFFGKLGETIRLNVPIVGGLSAKFTENAAALGVLGGVIGGVVVGYELLKKAIDIGSEVAESAKLLRNLSVETGVGVERLQQISSVTRDFGVDTAELGKGIYQLSRRIAGDDASASAALGVMGLNIQSLKKLAPDELFLTIMRAVNQIPDPLLKAAVGAQLFGSRFAQAFLAIGPGLDDMVEKAKTSGEVMSHDAVEGAARFSDSIDHLSLRLKALAGEGLAPTLDYVSRIIDAMRGGGLNAVAGLALLEPGHLISRISDTIVAGPAPDPRLENLAPMTPVSSHGPIAPVSSHSAADEAALLAMTNTLKTLRAQIVPLTTEQNAWLVSLAAIGPEFLTTANMLGSGITPQQLATWKDGLKIQQELTAARATAAKDNATAEAMETDGLQNAISTRIAALDAEHEARVRGIQLEVESGAKKHADLTAEEITYQAKRRLIIAEGTAAVLEIERASEEEIAKLQASNKTKSLADQLAGIDQEVYQQQQAALKKVGYTDDEWKAEYAIFLAGEARKQNLIDVSDKKEADAEAKLRAEIAGLDDQADKTGLARTISAIDAKEKLEMAALEAEVLTDEQRQIRLDLIHEKYGKERGNADLAQEREIGKELLKVQQETEDATIDLFTEGMNRELALNETKRQRILAQLHLEGKDQGEAGQALIDQTNALFDTLGKGIVAKFDPIAKAWKGLNADMRQEWADTWTKALQGTGSFVDALTSPFQQMEQRWKTLLGAMAADWESQLLAKLKINFGSIMNPGANAGGTTGNFDENGNWVPTGETAPTGPTVNGGAVVGAGLSSGIGAAASGGTIGHQIGQEGMTAAGVGVSAGVLAGSIGAGVAVGAATFGIGLAVIAAIAYIKSTLADKGRDIMRDIGVEFGTQISQGLQDTIKKDVEEGGWTEQAAEIAHLTDIITEAGGLTQKNLPQLTARLHDVFSMIETHQMTIEQGTKVLDDNWAAFAAAGTDADGRLSDSLKQIIQLQGQFGTQSKAIADYLKGQGANALSAFGTVAAAMLTTDKIAVWDDLKKKVDDATAAGTGLDEALKNQKDGADLATSGLKDLGIQAIATFTAAEAAGMSEADALKAIHPALASLQHAYEDLGISTDDAALAALMMRDKIATAAPALSAGISGLSGEMIALNNMGLLNASTFGAMERTGQSLYDQLIAKTKELGGTDADALGQMQKYLHEAMKAAEDLHVPLDANTQALIDQSKAAGIWQDALTPDDKMISAFGSLQKAVEHLTNALRGIPDEIDTTVTTHYQTDGSPMPRTYDGGTPMDGSAPGLPGTESLTAARGGWVTQTRMQPLPFMDGGIVPAYMSLGGWTRFKPQGTDTVAAMLTPGELVIPTGEQAAQQAALATMAGFSMPASLLDQTSYGAATASHLQQALPVARTGSTTTSGQTQITIEIHAVDAKSFDDLVRKNPDSITKAVIGAIEDNRRGATGQARRALQLGSGS